MDWPQELVLTLTVGKAPSDSSTTGAATITRVSNRALDCGGFFFFESVNVSILKGLRHRVVRVMKMVEDVYIRELAATSKRTKCYLRLITIQSVSAKQGHAFRMLIRKFRRSNR